MLPSTGIHGQIRLPAGTIHVAGDTYLVPALGSAARTPDGSRRRYRVTPRSCECARYDRDGRCSHMARVAAYVTALHGGPVPRTVRVCAGCGDLRTHYPGDPWCLGCMMSNRPFPEPGGAP